MRVTNAMTTRALSRRLLENQRLLAEAQERVASGKRVRKMSDDPTAGSAIMAASASLRGLEQYRRNVGRVSSQVDAEESALSQVTDLMTRAKELGIGTIGANVDAQGRRVAALEVRKLIEQVVNVANTKVGEEYLFGGTNNDGRAPITLPTTLPNGTRVFVPTDPPVPPATDPVPREPTGQRQVEIAAGLTMPGAHAGKEIFLDSGLLAAMTDLADAMQGDDPARMATALSALDGAFATTQGFVGEVGARQNQIYVVRAGLDALETTLTEQKSDLAEVDMEQAITEMVQRQTAYQAAMLASSRVMGLSLTDYLR